MNTEGEVVDKDNKVLNGTAIAAKIEFDLGKDDITDMILEEHGETLENQLKAVEKELKELTNKMHELNEKHQAYLVGEFKKEFASEIKSAKKFFGDVKIEPDVQAYVVALNPPKTFVINSYSNRDEHNRRPRRAVEHHQSVDGWNVHRGAHAIACTVKNPDNLVGTHSKAKFSYERAEWSLRRNYSDEEVLSMPVTKELAELDKTRQNLKGKIMQLEADMSNLETAGKRAKAKLVRSLLSASEQGRQLLTKMPIFNQRLALTDGNG